MAPDTRTGDCRMHGKTRLFLIAVFVSLVCLATLSPAADAAIPVERLDRTYRQWGEGVLGFMWIEGTLHVSVHATTKGLFFVYSCECSQYEIPWWVGLAGYRWTTPVRYEMTDTAGGKDLMVTCTAKRSLNYGNGFGEVDVCVIILHITFDESSMTFDTSGYCVSYSRPY